LTGARLSLFHANSRKFLRNFRETTGLRKQAISEFVMLRSIAVVLGLVAAVALGGCDTPRGRAMATDGAIGAGGGALLGAVAGFNPLVGAAVGGGAGAAVGATTH